MTRQDLKEYKYNKQWIEDKIQYIEELKESINKLTATISDMPKGSRQVEDGMAEKISSLMDSVNEILDKVNELHKKQMDIEKALCKIEQPYRNILDKVYIQGKTLVTIANEMSYNYEYMKRMHGIALNKFDEVTKSY